MTTPKGVNINVTKNGGDVYVDGYHDAGVEISFENLTSNDLDYTSGPKSPISFKAELQTLYSGGLPGGKIRNYMCLLLQQILREKKLQMEDNIFLKAYGHVGGSYLSLIKMYRRMSFRVFAVDSYEHKGFTVQNLRTFRINDLELQGIDFVLMYTTVGSLLNWCVKKQQQKT